MPSPLWRCPLPVPSAVAARPAAAALLPCRLQCLTASSCLGPTNRARVIAAGTPHPSRLVQEGRVFAGA